MTHESVDVDAAAVVSKASVTTEFLITDPAIAETFYDEVAKLREKCPVSWTDQWGGSWHLTTYDEVFEAAKNQGLFTTEGGASPIPNDLEALRMIPLELDDPKHRDIRRKLVDFFSRATVRTQEPIIRTIIQEKIAACVEKSPCDFIQNYSGQVPSRVFTSLVLLEDDPETVAWIHSTLDQLLDRPDSMGELAQPLLVWCHTMLERRRSEGKTDDVIGTIAHTGINDGVEISERERAQCLWLLINAGMETTQMALNSVGYLLATKPSLRHQLRDADERTLDRAVDELLRSRPPVTASNRTIRYDSIVGGCPMRAGDRVLVNWGGGSLDPDVFPDPNNFDLERTNANKHLSFGGGSHRCLGAPLAEAEIKITFEQLSRLEGFELVSEQEVQWRGGNVWGPTFMETRWEPSNTNGAH